VPYSDEESNAAAAADYDDEDAVDDGGGDGAGEGETTQDKKALKIVRIQDRAITVLTVSDE